MFADRQFQDHVARHLIMKHAFTATDLPEPARRRVVEWIRRYPKDIRSIGREFGQFLFDHFADQHIDGELAGIGIVDCATSVAEIMDARRQREQAAQTPGIKRNPDFQDWMDDLAAKAGFHAPDPLQDRSGKYPLPNILYSRLSQEAQARGEEPPARYVTREEEDDVILMLICEIMEGEVYWRARLQQTP